MPFLLDSDGRRKLCVRAVPSAMGALPPNPQPGPSLLRERGPGALAGVHALAERAPLGHPAPSLALSSFALSR